MGPQDRASGTDGEKGWHPSELEPVYPLTKGRQRPRRRVGRAVKRQTMGGPIAGQGLWRVRRKGPDFDALSLKRRILPGHLPEMAAAIRSAEAAKKNQKGGSGQGNVAIGNRLVMKSGHGKGWKCVHVGEPPLHQMLHRDEKMHKRFRLTTRTDRREAGASAT